MNEQAGVTQRLVERRDTHGVAWLTMNLPAARNALSMALMQALVDELAGIGTDPAVKVVVIRLPLASWNCFCHRSTLASSACEKPWRRAPPTSSLATSCAA